MKIHALTVCVNFADRLAIGLDRWLPGLDSLTVVTDEADRDTADLLAGRACRGGEPVAIYRTNAFYRDGAAFNKGAAMEEARRWVPWHDWVLFFDPDIVPPANWRQIVEETRPHAGNLYAAPRVQCDDLAKLEDPDLPRVRVDGIGVGFFQLFHTMDPALRGEAGAPLLPVDWTHAGGYDTDFMHRWHPAARRYVPGLRVVHVGARNNWFGRDNVEAFERMIEARKRSGTFDGERLSTASEKGV